MITQLNPPFPVITPLGEAQAYFIRQADNTVTHFGVFQTKTGENWWFDNRFVRLLPSITGERYGVSDIKLPADMAEALAPHMVRYR